MRKYIKTKSILKLGAIQNGSIIDFKLKSKSASDVLLCIFENPLGDIPFLTVEMEKEGDLFKISVPKEKLFKKKNIFYYGYRVFGENFQKVPNYNAGQDAGFISRVNNSGCRFNPNKLAYDPYSIELSHLHSAVSGDMAPFRSGEKNYLSDNSKIAPKSVFKIIKEQKIALAHPRALNEEIIAEVHIKDLTALLNVKNKGTYKAAKNFAKKIKKTGATMVEFLPLFEFDSYLDNKNYWGYMPLSFFAIKKGYSASVNPLAEFRNLINEFHKNDIKVCLDVVYNHTGEARVWGENDDAALFSYALIDNKNYYKLAQNAHYTNHSGCCNDFNTFNSIAGDMIVDSLDFWINQGVDAFRFDLAVALMDNSTSGYAMYDKNGGMLKTLKRRLEDRGHKINLPNESAGGINLIAEPWMCSGAYSYQLGNFPDYFAEWNDISRDTIRAVSINPKNVNPLGIRNVIEGAPQKFKGKIRSVNYVSCHDGFTLFDLNSFDKPSSDTKGGFAGEICSSFNGNILEQDNAIRKEILLLMVSAGVPMIQFGDIFLHSKKGNNNSYNIDEINRINYNLDERKEALSNYIISLIKFRRENKIFSKSYYTSSIEYLYPSGAGVNDTDDS
ncbi:MAG: hypothetical protein LUE64_06955, partial [Candidatus Gastranaerophilales bacterium]|nr:hypothetical protein [Candidatus Gastranaerophilales bacterium]